MNSKFVANLFKSCGLLVPFVVVSCGENPEKNQDLQDSTLSDMKNSEQFVSKKEEEQQSEKIVEETPKEEKKDIVNETQNEEGTSSDSEDK